MLMIAAAIMLIIYTTNAAMLFPKSHKAYINTQMPSIICRQIYVFPKGRALFSSEITKTLSTIIIFF